MNYKANIREHSFGDISTRERIMLKDLGNATPLDEATREGSIIIPVKGYAIIDVENEASPDKNYTKYLVIDTSGNKYTTGSNSFWKAFIDIFEEMEGEGEYSIEVYQKPSKNYSGKNFLSCSIV